MGETPKRKYKCNMIDHQADPEMSFRELDALVQEKYFTDLDGYESCIVCVFFGDEGNHDYRIDASSDDPDALYTSLRHNMALNIWLHCDINMDVIAQYKDKLDSAERVADLLDQIYDHPCGDHKELERLAYLLSHSYSMFLIDAAETAFQRGIKSQLEWFREVNAFEDNSAFADRPLATMTPDLIRDLLLKSREIRKAEIKRAQSVSFDYFRALEKADQFMDECLRVFEEGLEAYGNGKIHYILPTMFDALIKGIDDVFPLEFIETLSEGRAETSGNQSSKPSNTP